MQFINEMLFTHWFWLGLAILLIIFEVVLGANFFLLWVGLLAALVGIVAGLFPHLMWQYQVLLFSVGSIGSIGLWYYYLKTARTKTDRPTLNRRAEQYIDRTFVLSDPIVNGRGKIEVDDSMWRVEGPELPAGTRVVVVGVDGVILKVKAKE